MVAAASLAAATTAQAQSDAARIAELEARIGTLENRQSEPLSFGSGTGTTIDFYGYIKADFSYDFGYDLGNTTFALGGIGTGVEEGDFFSGTARQTRLGFNTTTSTAYGDLGGQVEIDFYGGDGTPRLRHATVTLGGFRAGKYWTTFMPLASYPSTLDFQGVAGIPFARQEMIRYTHGVGENFNLTFALETSVGDSDDPMAIFVADYDTDPLLLRMSAIYGTANDDFGGSEDVYGFNFSTTAALWSGATLDASYTYGEGIGSYLVFFDETTDVSATGDAIEVQSAYVGLSQDVGEKLVLRAIYGYQELDEGPANGTESLSSVHLNAQDEIIENLQLGAEYFYGTRDTFAGGSYDVDRIQTSIQYSF